MSGDGDHELGSGASSNADGNTVDLHLGPAGAGVSMRGEGGQRDRGGQSLEEEDVVDVEEVSLEELGDPESDELDELEELEDPESDEEEEDEDDEPDRLSFL